MRVLRSSGKNVPNVVNLSILKNQSCLKVMSDDGWCLTMHQPWASYLVSGIKMHEGRTWYSSHRGRLWIHAAAKVPTDEEIKSLG